MAKSPGHRAHPDHKVEEKTLGRRVQVEVDGKIVADSTNVIEVDEDASPPRYYFPRDDVKMDMLERTETTSKCPYKGTAHYYSLKIGDQTLEDAVWTYEDPYDEHTALKGRLAFYDDKLPQIDVRPA